MNYRGAWQQALSVLGRNTSRTAPVRNQSPALYWHLAGSCSKILPSAQAGLSGQMPAQTLSVMSVTGLQSGVGSPATTGPKRSVPFLRLARPKSPHQNRKAVRPTATLPHCLKRILTISLALNLILRPLYCPNRGMTVNIVAICAERRKFTADMQNMPKAILPGPRTVKSNVLSFIIPIVYRAF
jgi:hypothetical protein